jgi:urease accessory protein
MKGKKYVSIVSLLLVSQNSFAHVSHLMHANFADGFLHPLTGWDHLTAFTLIGIFLAGFGVKTATKLSTLVMLAVAGGYAIGLGLASAEMVEVLVTVSLIILPAAIWALRQGWLTHLTAIIALAAFSACHGIVQGVEAQGSVFQFGLGSLVASLLVMGVAYGATRAISALFRSKKDLRKSL